MRRVSARGPRLLLEGDLRTHAGSDPRIGHSQHRRTEGRRSSGRSKGSPWHSMPSSAGPRTVSRRACSTLPCEAIPGAGPTPGLAWHRCVGAISSPSCMRVQAVVHLPSARTGHATAGAMFIRAWLHVLVARLVRFLGMALGVHRLAPASFTSWSLHRHRDARRSRELAAPGDPRSQPLGVRGPLLILRRPCRRSLAMGEPPSRWDRSRQAPIAGGRKARSADLFHWLGTYRASGWAER